VTPIWEQAGNSGRFPTAPGRAVSIKNETVWMFDNEIDWVMRIGHLSLVLAAEEAAGRTTVLMTQYKAEHIVGLQL